MNSKYAVKLFNSIIFRAHLTHLICSYILENFTGYPTFLDVVSTAAELFLADFVEDSKFLWDNTLSAQEMQCSLERKPDVNNWGDSSSLERRMKPWINND